MIKFRSTKRKDGCRVVFAYDDRKKVAWIGACQSTRYLEVQKVYVVEAYRRQGLATQLYTKMAEVACAIDRPLASAAWQRNYMSDPFWKKQIARGRATVDRDMTIINCPITSLDGSRRRR